MGAGENFELGLQLGLSVGWDIAKEFRFKDWEKLGLRTEKLFFKRVELLLNADNWALFCRLCQSTGQYIDSMQVRVYGKPSKRLSLRHCGSLKSLSIQCELSEWLPIVDTKTLPDSLTSLYLPCAGLTHTHTKQLGRLKRLECLYLQGNPIGELPASLYELPNLRELGLDHCQISGLDGLRVGHWQQLTALSLAKNLLRWLPDSIDSLPNLKSCSLDWLNLDIIPAWAQRFSARRLYGERNLPAGLENLGYIDAIYCQFANSAESPTQIPALLLRKDLRTLNMRNGSIAQIAENLGACSHLEYLHLPNNALKQLPDSISEVTRLKVVDLSQNQLARLDFRLSTNALNLSQNPIRHISANFCGSYILYLSMQGCDIEALPEEFGNLPLRKLNLSANKLKNLPASFARLRSLAQLNLSKNPLGELPAELLRDCVFLHSLDLSGCQIECLGDRGGALLELPEGLNILDLCKNWRMGGSDCLRGRLKSANLATLLLSNCRLCALEEDFFMDLPNLEHLYLRGNPLRALPASLWSIRSLKKLDLRSTEAEKLLTGSAWEAFLAEERPSMQILLDLHRLPRKFRYTLFAQRPKWLKFK